MDGVLLTQRRSVNAKRFPLGQQGVGSDFDGDGDMEEVHPADGNGESVFGTEIARSADGVAPVKLRVRPVAEPDFLFEEADQFAGFAWDDDAPTFELAQRIENLDPLPWRPCDLDVGPEVEGMNGRAVVGVIGDFASDPP